MARKESWVPRVYRRRGKEYARVRVGPGEYADRTLGPAGSAEARREYSRLLAELEANHGRLAERKPDVTVNELALAYRVAMRQEKGRKDYWHVKKALAPAIRLYGATPAVEFGPVAFRAVRGEWVKAGYCRRVASKYSGIVRRWFRWCSSREMIPHQTAAALRDVEPLRKGQAPDLPPVRPPRGDEVERTLPFLPGVVADMVRLQQHTGMRPGEVCALRPMDIDREWKVIDGVAVWLYRLDEHKNDWRGDHRWAPIGPKGQAVLAKYLLRPADAYCFSPAETVREWLESKRKEKPVPKWKLEGKQKPGRKPSPGRKPVPRKRPPGARYLTEAYDACVRRGCRRATEAERKEAVKAGQEPPPKISWSPNQIRHAVGTQVEADHGREDARVVLGHKNPTTTSIYAEGVERAARVVARMG